MSTQLLPPVAPEVLADAVEQLSARLRKKLDAAISGCAGQASATADSAVEVHFGEDAAVTLRPGPSGTVTNAEQAVCTCLLAPRCLHRAAVLGAAPIADGEGDAAGGDDSGTGRTAGSGTASETGAGPEEAATTAPTADFAATAVAPAALTTAQVRAATALWDAAAEALSAGVTASGAVVQAELLRAAHTARLAGLPRAEAAALRVVRSLRAARSGARDNVSPTSPELSVSCWPTPPCLPPGRPARKRRAPRAGSTNRAAACGCTACAGSRCCPRRGTAE